MPKPLAAGAGAQYLFATLHCFLRLCEDVLEKESEVKACPKLSKSFQFFVGLGLWQLWEFEESKPDAGGKSKGKFKGKNKHGKGTPAPESDRQPTGETVGSEPAA